MIKKLIILSIFFINILHSSDSKTNIKLQLQWKNQYEFAGFYMAKEKGYYDDIGVNVEFIEFESGIDIVDEVLSGNKDFGIWNSSLISEWLNGKEITLLSNYFKTSPLALITRPEIKVPSDLIGKNIMIHKADLNSANYQQMFNMFDINSKNTNFYEPNFSIKDFGRYDAISIFMTNEPFEFLKNSISYNIIYPNNYGIDLNDVNLFTSKKFSKENPKLTENFTKASTKGWKYAVENIEETVNIIYEKYNTQNKSKEALLYEAYQSQKFIQSKYYELGKIYKDKLEKIAKLYIELGLAQNSKDINEFIYSSNAAIKINELTNSEKEYLKNKKIIKMCVDPNWMPFESIVDNEYKGISQEIFNLIEKKTELNIQLYPTTSWHESLEKIKNRDCDILSLAMKTKKREEYLDFTNPYLKYPYVIATQKDKLYIDKIESIIDEEIALVKSYAINEVLKNMFPNKKFINVKNVKEGLDLVKDGKAYAFIGTVISIAYTMQENNYINLKISGKSDLLLKLSIATRNDEPHLNSIMEKALSLISEKEKQEAYKHWFQVKFDQTIDYTMIWKVAIVLIIIIAISIYFNNKLFNEKRKTQRILNNLKVLQKELEQKNKELERTSITDKLTNTYNRYKIDEVLNYELKRTLRNKDTFGLILLDVDFFKSVNDKFGHNIGDKVLVSITKTVKDNIRQSDVFGRWGGEEFLIIVPNTNKEDLIFLAQKIRRIIEVTPISIVGHKTCSFGLTVSKENDTSNKIVERADNALYFAKHNGRNRVEFID